MKSPRSARIKYAGDGPPLERAEGSEVTFTAMARLDSAVDVEYFKDGGILQTVRRKLAGE